MSKFGHKDALNDAGRALTLLQGYEKAASSGSYRSLLRNWAIVHHKDGGGVDFYSGDDTGLAAAVAAVANGSVVEVCPGTYSGNYTFPANTEFMGVGDTVELAGTITNNGAISHMTISGTLTNNGTLNDIIDSNGYTQMTGRLGIGISPSNSLHSDSALSHRAMRVSSPDGYDSTLQFYTRDGTDYEGWAVLKDRVAGDFEIHYDATEGVESYTPLHIDAADGEVWIGSKGSPDYGSALATRRLTIADKAADSSNEWGMNTSSVGGGTRFQIVDADDEYTADKPLVWIERKHDGNWPGSGDPSTPVCIYAQHEQTGSNTAFTHTAMFLAINSGTGDNDVVAVSGRAKKDGAGVGDSAGVWGSAYNNVNQNGGVMGVEGHIYQNIAGMVAADSMGSKWSAAIHARSDSTGSDALAGLLISGANTYRLWNGILIDGSAFRGSGAAGTVGLNMAGAYPEYGIKFGDATRHIYGTGDIEIEAAGGNVIIYGAAAKFDFEGTAGGGNEAITYLDSGSTQRNALMFPGSDVVALVNRAANGVVQIRANSSTAGSGGEATAAQFEDDQIYFYQPTEIDIPSATDVGLTVKAAVSQSADILELLDSSDNVLCGADERGILFSHGGIDVNSVFIGSNAGNISDSGSSSNIGIGTQVMQSITSAARNFGAGWRALRYLEDGVNNVALGSQCLQDLVSGSYNMMQGTLAGQHILGSNNVGVGERAMLGAASADVDNNVGIGRGALQKVATGADANTAVGYASGNSLTTGASNIFIGNYSGYRQTTNSNLLIIDNQIRADVATEATNAIIYGVMAASPGSQSLQINADLIVPGNSGNLIETDYSADKIGFFGATPIVQPSEITDELTTITYTAPGTPDYAIQDLVAEGGAGNWGFATQDEGNTVLSVIANLQARVNELETTLVSLGLLVDAD